MSISYYKEEQLAEIRLLIADLPSSDAIVVLCSRVQLFDTDLISMGTEGMRIKVQNREINIHIFSSSSTSGVPLDMENFRSIFLKAPKADHLSGFYKSSFEVDSTRYDDEELSDSELSDSERRTLIEDIVVKDREALGIQLDTESEKEFQVFSFSSYSYLTESQRLYSTLYFESKIQIELIF